MTNHPTQAGHTAALPADLVGDDAAKLAGALELVRSRDGLLDDEAQALTEYKDATDGK